MIRLCYALILLTASCFTSANDVKPVSEVLFIGNSYTYYWNMPQQVMAMAKSRGQHIKISHSTAGGAKLKEHWEGAKELTSRARIAQGNFDIVVLQDHSLRALKAPQSLHQYGKLFQQLNQQHGAKTLFYMTWARAHKPEMLATIEQQYSQLAKDTNSELIPVGKVWRKVQTMRPDLDLYHPDKSHPSPLGSYLTACIFYTELSDTSPLGLPNTLFIDKNDGSRFFLNSIDEKNAVFLQQVTHDLIHEFR